MKHLSAWTIWVAMPLWVLACIFWASAAQASQFGCKGLANNKDMPVLEGKDGVFFRIQSDLRMDHRVSDYAIAGLASLSQALAEKGTLLVYLPVPTKALAMPQMLPADASLYGYDAEIAASVYSDLIAKMEASGVVAVNATPEMRSLPTQTPPFFKADFHWTGFGARAAATALAQRLEREQTYQDMPKSDFVSRVIGEETAFSGLRRLLQRSCHKALPKVTTMRFVTEKIGEETSQIDLFGTSETPQVVLVGTSFSDSEINNFAGFFSEMTRLDVVNRALTGGNQFGAIQDYLTSRDFQENRPDILIWENPIYNSLTRFGDQPMRELIAAARGDCKNILAANHASEIQLDLPSTISPRDTILVDYGSRSVRKVAFRFTNHEGTTVTRVVKRSARQTSSGRFSMPFSGLGDMPPQSIVIQTSDPTAENARVFLCSNPKGENS